MKMVQSGWFIGELIHDVGEPLLKAGVERLKRKVKRTVKDTIEEIAKNAPLIA